MTLRIMKPALAVLAVILPLAGQAQTQTKADDKPARHHMTLSDMDADKDGKVTTAEFDAALAKSPRHGGDHDGKGPTGGKAAGAPPSGSGNGTAPQRPTGASLDTNGDGVVSQDEFDGFVAKMPKPPRHQTQDQN